MALTIRNPLGLDWPWELVHVTTNLTGSVAVRISDELRPTQSDGSNIWFLATLSGKSPLVIDFTNAVTASPLRFHEGIIANGAYEYRLDGGFRAAGDTSWYGSSRIDGDLGVPRTEVLDQGPVFVTIRQTWPAGFERILRFVANDPWIDVTERYDLAAPASHWLELRDGLRPDTVFWVPWFGHGGFEPIGTMQTHPLKPQAKQGARPFVTLSPRWNQQPGGGMDFFVTRSESNAPSVGIIATRPSAWIEPNAQAIECHVENGDTARIRFPLHRGSRSYALVIGPKSLFDSQGKLDSLVRRHTDWTLDDQMNKYILEWDRDPSKAGPCILITGENLAKLQDDYRTNRDTPAMRAVRKALANGDKQRGNDQALLDLITGKPTGNPSPPNANLWIGRRYQDNFLNPTTYTRTVKYLWPGADLLSNGQPIGGPWQAALGYIFTDPNHWPGWLNGWHPGNPNFHTDKYMVALLTGAAMRDHPHAPAWIAYGRQNFDADVAKVFFEPDGVGYECPGYSGYSLGLQLEIARVFLNIGDGNLVATNPLWKKNAIWHRHLLTPIDRRLGIRHEAPIGDTHRWNAGGVNQFGVLAGYYAQSDPSFASELMGIHQLMLDQGSRESLFDAVVNIPHEVVPQPLEKMDWGSHAFNGFGAVMRSRFGTPRETFVSFKAGAAHGHYHNDELSYHFHGDGTPLSLDYNCSYHPRGDHAALHNSLTFGTRRSFRHEEDPHEVEAQEQIWGRARMLGFATTAAADLAVGERSGDSLNLSPIYPDQARFGYRYPTRKLEQPITHRRYLMLVKHGQKSQLADYLVIRDETISTEPQQLNIHLLARDVTQDGPILRATGQWDTDAVIYLAHAEVRNVSVGRWYYVADSKQEPSDVQASDGKCLIPPVSHEGTWTVGEYQKWVRIESPGGSTLLWILYPKKQGAPEPVVTPTGKGDGFRLALGSETDEITITSGRTVVRQGDIETILPVSVPPLR
jgi:hypothetical protein